jgi:hypothetical protein
MLPALSSVHPGRSRNCQATIIDAQSTDCRVSLTSAYFMYTHKACHEIKQNNHSGDIGKYLDYANIINSFFDFKKNTINQLVIDFLHRRCFQTKNYSHPGRKNITN